MRALQVLAKMLGCHEDDADEAMRSERGYRAAMSRRSLLAAGAALAVGRTLFEGVELAPQVSPWDPWEGAIHDEAIAAMMGAMGAVVRKASRAKALPPEWAPIDLSAQLKFMP